MSKFRNDKKRIRKYFKGMLKEALFLIDEKMFAMIYLF